MAINLENMRKFMSLARQAEVIYESDTNWETKYDLIFGLHIRGESGVNFDYCDPDTSYEDDVRAYMGAVREKMAEFYKIKAALDEANIDIGDLSHLTCYLSNWHNEYAVYDIVRNLGYDWNQPVDNMFQAAYRIYNAGLDVMLHHDNDSHVLTVSSKLFIQR